METVKNDNASKAARQIGSFNKSNLAKPKKKAAATKSQKIFDKKSDATLSLRSNPTNKKNLPDAVSSKLNSLVRYETPFLVPTTISNKKLLQELSQDNEEAEIFIKKIINTFSIDSTDYSLKDALNKILPPKKIKIGDQMWVQYVSCNPVTSAEVVNLMDGLQRRLVSEGARMQGVCPVREELVEEVFLELIRQITVNCLERGILLMRVKTESAMLINHYKTLYESCVAYGIRTFLKAEEEKNYCRNKISKLEDEIEDLEVKIKELEEAFENKKKEYEIERNKVLEEHSRFVMDIKADINKSKNEIKVKLSYN